MIKTYKVNLKHFKETTLDEIHEKISKMSFVSIDTETEGFFDFKNKIILLQIGNKDYQFVINYKNLDFSEINIIKDILKEKVLIFHNSKFDLKFLYNEKFDIRYNNIIDTFILESLLIAGDENKYKLSLKEVAKKYLDIDLDKTIRGKIHKGIDKSVIEYAANDIKHLEDIAKAQLKIIRKYNMHELSKLECKLSGVLAKMELNGIKLDTNKWLSIYDETSKKVKELEDKLDEVLLKQKLKELDIYKAVQLDLFDNNRNTIVNWSSNPIKLDILNKLGLKVSNVSNSTLVKIKNEHEIIPLLLEYNKQKKIATTYGLNFISYINPITNRVHTNFWQILSTGRMSSSDPSLLNIPTHGELATKIKNSFIAEEGYTLIDTDYSSMELRILADLSKDPLWLDIYKKDLDLHSILCSETFGIPIENVKDPYPNKPEFNYRHIQKTLNFGLAYGMSKYKLSEILDISVEEAEEIINKFFSKVPKVKEFIEKSGEFGKIHGYSKTPPPYNRRRFFDNFYNQIEDVSKLSEIERASKNHPIQGANADITKTALIMIQEEIDKKDLPMKLLLSIHDATLVEAKDEYLDECIEIVQRNMIVSAKMVLKNVEPKVETVTGKYWKH
ncbi:MAG: hypothetical protein HPY57_12630 [Ignavibacteria bacterium]|nr:hypothetical protein [Ignavibacteria bacterium]